MDRDQYEKDLEQRQAEHLRRVRTNPLGWEPCAHDGCTQCHGTGIKLDGSQCIHMIACRCPKCSPGCISVSMDNIVTSSMESITVLGNSITAV